MSDDYLCHFCNDTISEDDIEYLTEYNGREFYFCSENCMYQWLSVDDGVIEEEYN